MKRRFINLIALILNVLIVFSSVCGIAYGANNTKVVLTDGNADFAVKSAEIVKSYDGQKEKGKFYTQSLSVSLRIIGKVKNGINDISEYDCVCAVLNADNRFIMQFSDFDTFDNSLREMKNDGNIIYAVSDDEIFTQGIEENTEENYSWGVEALGMDKYSDFLQHSDNLSPVIVAVVDSGVADVGFISEKLISGYDFLDNDVDATNDTSSDSHGTFLGSIIADSTRNLPVKIMPVRVLSSGSGTLSNAINGIYYAVDNGADVINFSLGGVFGDCSAIDEAMEYADSHGVTVVVCAGNKKMDTAQYCPAHNESVITVSSVNQNLEFSSSFSNYGNSVDCCAPGEKIEGLSADGNKKNMSGTSMSAAFISAGAAMFKLANNDCNSKQVQSEIKRVCTDLGEKNFDKYYGYGIPDFSSFSDNSKIYLKGINLSESNVEITVGEEHKMEAIFLPSNADDKSLVWETSDNRIAVVDENGVITAVSPGECRITAISIDGGFDATCNVKVVPNNHTVTWVIGDVVIKQKLKSGETISPPEISGIYLNRFLGWDKQIPEYMPNTDLIFNAILVNDFNISVAPNLEIDYRSIVFIKATAVGVPEGYYLAIFIDGKEVKRGTNTEVSYEYGELKGDLSYTVKVIDKDGNVQKDGNNKALSEEGGKITCKAGFIQKLVAFFKGLFGSLPKVEVKP